MDALHVLERVTGGAVVRGGKVWRVVLQHHVASLRVDETHGDVGRWLTGAHPHHAHLCDTRHCIHYNTTSTVSQQ